MEDQPAFEEGRLVSLAEVKSMLTRAQQSRAELTYEQKLALEHSLRFSKLPLDKTEKLIRDLQALGFVNDLYAYKMADVCPVEAEEVRAIFAKSRTTVGDKEVQDILETVGKYYVP